jgi:bacillithiol biosynthesis cysteine-adding enzyme BshC
LSTAEAACYSSPEESGLHVETLAFERIPNQSRLFLDYLRDPLTLKRFYPSAVRFHHELAQRAPEVLAAYTVDRNQVCDALLRMNTAWGASPQTLKNQQSGLFTGPLYTVYKAITAVKLAGCLSQRNTKAVPVFWIATEDHDFIEVAKAEFINRDCQLANVNVATELHKEGQPVGKVVLDNSIEQVISRLVELLPNSEFISEVETILRNSWIAGRTYGDAFARMMTALIGRYGLVLLDPLDESLKRLAAPLYSEAARRAPEIATAVAARSRELEEAGYHAQVLVTDNSFPLFIHDANGARHAVVRTENGKYKAKATEEEHSADELAQRALAHPEDFSPNVLLRAVVQDYLLPTVAYVGGSAEIAYFAQTAEVYRLLQRPVTPILPRSSLTVVEPHTGRVLERYGLSLVDLFAGAENVLARVVEEYLGADTAKTFTEVELNVNKDLDKLREQLREIDPTLADALETGRRKINYQLEGLRTRFHRAQMGRDETAQRQLQRALDQLYPEKALQERHINITSLLARHGSYVMEWIYNAINLGSTEHHIVCL